MGLSLGFSGTPHPSCPRHFAHRRSSNTNDRPIITTFRLKVGEQSAAEAAETRAFAEHILTMVLGIATVVWGGVSKNQELVFVGLGIVVMLIGPTLGQSKESGSLTIERKDEKVSILGSPDSW